MLDSLATSPTQIAEPVAPARMLVINDPATGEPVAEVAVTPDEDVVEAVRLARAAAPRWARVPVSDRAAALKAWARALTARADEIAALITDEMGKPITDAAGGVDAGISAVEQYAELGVAHRGRRLAGAHDADDVMERRPRGVVAVLLPWNDPVALACAQIAAAVVTGNTVVVKASERAQLGVGCALDALPDELRGVVLSVVGDGKTGETLVEQEGVDLVIHTGSVATGRKVAVACAARLRKVLLELGGNDVVIVDDGVDPNWAADQVATGAFANAGQLCVSAERIIVHRAIAEPFIAALVGAAETLRVGPGHDPDTQMGPLVDRRHREGVRAVVDAAAEAGATVLTGGVVPDGPGAFYPPTVVLEPPVDSTLWTQEIFGPVAPVVVVDDFAAALHLACEGGYGLAATVLTSSEIHAREAVQALEVGTVKVNAVFGGAPGGSAEPRRESGLGVGYGPELLDELTAWTVVHREVAPAPTP